MAGRDFLQIYKGIFAHQVLPGNIENAVQIQVYMALTQTKCKFFRPWFNTAWYTKTLHPCFTHLTYLILFDYLSINYRPPHDSLQLHKMEFRYFKKHKIPFAKGILCFYTVRQALIRPYLIVERILPVWV